MSGSFYNTVEESGQILLDLDASAKVQEERVLEIFKLNSHRSLTTREAHVIYITKYDASKPIEIKTPSDSIKRAITNLTKKQELIKNPKSEQVKGTFGVSVFTWRINKEQTLNN